MGQSWSRCIWLKPATVDKNINILLDMLPSAVNKMAMLLTKLEILKLFCISPFARTSPNQLHLCV